MGNEQKLKIVKWTAGLDHSVVGRAKQLYPAFGDGILKKVDRVGKMRVANPLEYIQEADV